MSAAALKTPPPQRKRTILRSSSDHRGTHALHGVGRAVVQSVGDCNHTTGADVSIQRDGDEEPLGGYLRFRALIDPDQGVIWRRSRPGYPLMRPESFSPAEIEAACALVERMAQWSPNAYLFHVLGAAQIAWTHHERAIQHWAQSIKTLERLLADPLGPQPVTMEGPMSPAQRAERVMWWRKRLAQDEQALVDHLVDYADNIHRLRRVLTAIHYACTRSTGRLGYDDIGATIAAAIHPTRPVERRGLVARWGRLADWNPAGWPWAEPGPAWD